MSYFQIFTNIFHFCENFRHHASKVNMSWLTKSLLVCSGSEGPVRIPFSVTLC